MLDMAVGLDENRYYARLGSALRDLRKEARLSAKAAADRARVDTETIWRWERGEPAIRAYQLAALAELYGLSPEAYYHLVDPEEPVNPWRDRVGHAEAAADERFAERADAARREAQKRSAGEGSPGRRAPRSSAG